MKKMMMVIALAAVCLSLQGCYIFAEREGQYFASTKMLMNEKDGPGAWFPDVHTVGTGMYIVGCFIPVVGWVTLCPAGVAVDSVERFVVAPTFDIICLPYDSINKRPYSDSEIKGSEMTRSLKIRQEKHENEDNVHRR